MLKLSATLTARGAVKQVKNAYINSHATRRCYSVPSRKKRTLPKKSQGFARLLPQIEEPPPENCKKYPPFDWSYPFTLPRSKAYMMEARLTELKMYLAYKLGVHPLYAAYEYLKHPKRQFIKVKVVRNTVKQLMAVGFKKEVIAESVALTFYPWSTVQVGLRLVKENSLELTIHGFKGGFTDGSTPRFARGTYSRDKRLQLCLYYIEQPFFDGGGLL
ncbi:UNVERIFIED_CONTAM: hypothetical protein PYX00_002334 [Menopon gallinae]|uniref:39S ribosomal protein L22, mitochondrial n=1 Tax=Menopon gallinae TaxID=328185 RepID=A0AAW2IG23_9NEOP